MTDEKQPEHRLLTRLPEPLWQLIKQDAADNHLSVNYVVVNALAKHYGIEVNIAHRAPKRKKQKE